MASVTCKTIVYKTISTPFHELKLDIYYPFTTPTPLPIVLRLHGGGLLQGNRGSCAPHLLNGISKHGFAMVSADYRLAPQAPMSAILDDVLDCLQFIRTELTAHIDSSINLDTSRIAILGALAGGYLALLAAVHAKVKPNVVLAIYPITDPFGIFFTQPQPHSFGKIDRAVVAPFLDEKAEVVSDPDPESDRKYMYYYMLQEAILSELLQIQDTDEQFIVSKALKKHGGQALPPIYIVHGDDDKLVGIEQSDEVVDALREIHAIHKYDIVHGADHLFDRDEKIDMSDMYAFMATHL